MNETAKSPRLVCFVNGIYSRQLGGGDIYFSHIARAALESGYHLHFFGGHALQAYLENQKLPLNLTLTDSGMADLGDVSSLPGFKAVIIGKSREQLASRVQELGLAGCVTFAGLVSEEEKFRLLKASRVFAMPSRYESWGIVVGEALAAGIPVVAYDLECYRPVFGDFVRYVQAFDRGAFARVLAREIESMRAGHNYLDSLDLIGLKTGLSWRTSRQAFRGLLDSL